MKTLADRLRHRTNQLEASIKKFRKQDKAQRRTIRHLETAFRELGREFAEQKRMIWQLETKGGRKSTKPITVNRDHDQPGDPIFELKRIIANVCSYPFSELKNRGSNRPRDTWPHMLGMDLCQYFKLCVAQEAAEAFGREGHGSALYARKQVRAMIETPPLTSIHRMQYFDCRRQFEEYLRQGAGALSGATKEFLVGA